MAKSSPVRQEYCLGRIPLSGPRRRIWIDPVQISEITSNSLDSLEDTVSHDLASHKLRVEAVPIGIPDEALAVLQSGPAIE